MFSLVRERSNVGLNSDNSMTDPITNSNASCEFNVLVADQNAIEANLLKIFLSQICSRVVEVQEGRTVVETVEESLLGDAIFNVVILSNQLGDIDGIETTRLLRSVGFAGSIVGTSTNVSPEIKRQWTAAGCNAFLEKPISNRKITELITRLVNER